MRSPGVLLIQLGTPDAPDTPSLRRYLRQFLGDPRVIDLPRWKWRPILELFVLPFRPSRSAKKYQRIWNTQTGSPLLHYTRRQAEELGKALPGIPVDFGMQVGNPSLESTLTRMIGQGVDHLVVLPMYPQYSATTVGSAYDVLGHALKNIRRVPNLRVIRSFHDHPAYLDAVVTIIREQLVLLAKEDVKPDHHVISFHGLPIRYSAAGDPYATQVEETTRLLVERLGWQAGEYTQSYQSLFGREEWLKPYTDGVLENLAKAGAKNVFVVTPGFTSDCLETLDEIGNEASEIFRHAGGQKLVACPCLNDHPKWIEAMRTIVLEEARGWFA